MIQRKVSRLIDKWAFVYGTKAIAAMCGVCERTIRNWIKKHDFPVIKSFNGQLATCQALIDNWLLDRYIAQRKKAK